MYQLEVKRWLVHHQFPPSRGWKVTVDIDAMERAKGGNHPPGKKARVEEAEVALRQLGVAVGAHESFGRADVVAEHDNHGTVIFEVEGESSRQREQALYSALGQTVLSMGVPDLRYGLAVPDDPQWEMQLQKIPLRIKQLLTLQCVLVGREGVREV